MTVRQQVWFWVRVPCVLAWRALTWRFVLCLALGLALGWALRLRGELAAAEGQRDYAVLRQARCDTVVYECEAYALACDDKAAWLRAKLADCLGLP
jgi:hypothetical protein